MLEGTISNIPPQGGRKHPEQQYIQMDTTHILFICGGTFTGLDEIIGRRLGHSAIGFAGEMNEEDDVTRESKVLGQVTPEDLVEFGMIPELIGRLPIISVLEPLSTATLSRILTEPKNALVRQYQRLFEMEGCELEITPEALTVLAAKALKRDTGARALRSVMEEMMLDVMFRLPEEGAGGKYVCSESVARGEVDLFSQRVRRKESA
jgi:ATP-dependent Clp protease ATP-binding subunit ClpX